MHPISLEAGQACSRVVHGKQYKASGEIHQNAALSNVYSSHKTIYMHRLGRKDIINFSDGYLQFPSLDSPR